MASKVKSSSSSNSSSSSSNVSETPSSEEITHKVGSPSSGDTEKEVDDALAKAKNEREVLRAARDAGLGLKRKVDQLQEIRDEIDRFNKPAGGKAKEPIGFLNPDGIWTESRSKTTEQNSQVTAPLRRFVAVNIYEKTALAEGTQFDEEQLRQSIVYYLDLVLTQSFSEACCMSIIN